MAASRSTSMSSCLSRRTCPHSSSSPRHGISLHQAATLPQACQSRLARASCRWRAWRAAIPAWRCSIIDMLQESVRACSPARTRMVARTLRRPGVSTGTPRVQGRAGIARGIGRGGARSRRTARRRSAIRTVALAAAAAKRRAIARRRRITRAGVGAGAHVLPRAGGAEVRPRAGIADGINRCDAMRCDAMRCDAMRACVDIDVRETRWWRTRSSRRLRCLFATDWFALIEASAVCVRARGSGRRLYVCDCSWGDVLPS